MNTKQTSFLRAIVPCLASVLLALAPVIVSAQSTPPAGGNTLTVELVGTGTVSSQQPATNGIQCPGQCSITGSSAVLAASPAPGNTFQGWSGACSGTGLCIVSLASGSQKVYAAFSPVIPNAQVKDTCINSCFGACTNPLTFSNCVVGCSAANSTSVDQCVQACGTDQTCMSSCIGTMRCIATTTVSGSLISSKCGAMVFNRSTQVWQLTVLVTNTDPAKTVEGVALLLNALAPGWTLMNGDGMTIVTDTTGSPYKNLGPLAPNSTTSVVLTFARSGAAGFGYVPQLLQIPQSTNSNQ